MAQVIKIKCFELLTDTIEGYSRREGFLASEAEAKRWTEVNPAWRRHREYEEEIVISDTLEEYEGLKEEAERTAALKKLTPRERKLLGF